MAFVVEDGTGLTNSNALISVAFADEYHTDRGNAAWTGDATAKQGAIVRATGYVCNRFRIKYPKFKDEQALSFPILCNGEAQMPVKMQQAVAEYAVRALTIVLAPDPVTDATGGRVIEKREKVGPLEEATKYAESTGFALLKPYPAADMLMRDFVTSGGNRVIR